LSAAAPEPVVLSPETMADHGFQVKCVLYKPAPGAVDRAAPGDALPLVRLHFDPKRGPAIEAAESVSLVIRDGDQPYLSVPVRLEPYLGNDGGLWVRFRMREKSLSDAQLVIQTKSNGRFLIAPKSFLPKKE
jgi:hypothetical protein